MDRLPFRIFEGLLEFESIDACRNVWTIKGCTPKAYIRHAFSISTTRRMRKDFKNYFIGLQSNKIIIQRLTTFNNVLTKF